MFGLLIPLIVLAFLAIIIALGVYAVLRVRSGEPMRISFSTIVLAYFYLMSIASFLVLVAGLSIGVKAGLSDVLGPEFSYYVQSPVRMVPAEVPTSGVKPTDMKPQPVPADELERSRRQAERQYQEDVLQAGTMVVVGGIVWALHRWGRRRAEAQGDGTQGFFSKAYMTIMLALFGIVGLISLAMGVYEVLRYWIIPVDEVMSRQPPGSTIATAIVFVPIWLYFLYQALGKSGRETQPES